MAPGSQTGSAPVAAGDTDVLVEEFENLYDVPFIAVNMIDGRIVAEVERGHNDTVTLARVQEAKEVARRNGQHLFARTLGDREYPELAGVDYGVITLYFTPDTITGGGL